MKDPFKVPPPPPPQMIPQGYPLWLITTLYGDDDCTPRVAYRELVIGWVLVNDGGFLQWEPVTTHEDGFAVLDATKKAAKGSTREFTVVPPESGMPETWTPSRGQPWAAPPGRRSTLETKSRPQGPGPEVTRP